VEGDVYLGIKLLGLLPIKKKRELLRMPPMAMRSDKMNLNCFKTKNGLVDDPIAAEQERKTLNPWSAEEKKIFLEKYLLFGKNLRKIAAFLEYKTVADCVQFYYLNQKAEEFQKIRHEHLLKKQRDLRSRALYLSATTSSSEQCDLDDACLEGLSLVAAAAAAMSSPAGASGKVFIIVFPKMFSKRFPKAILFLSFT
jgi:nuclear receptor co-repressor 1